VPDDPLPLLLDASRTSPNEIAIAFVRSIACDDGNMNADARNRPITAARFNKRQAINAITLLKIWKKYKRADLILAK
jgi:hypothetical protein